MPYSGESGSQRAVRRRSSWCYGCCRRPIRNQAEMILIDRDPTTTTARKREFYGDIRPPDARAQPLRLGTRVRGRHGERHRGVLGAVEPGEDRETMESATGRSQRRWSIDTGPWMMWRSNEWWSGARGVSQGGGPVQEEEQPPARTLTGGVTRLIRDGRHRSVQIDLP
jgi:hypothetical protein